jgi:serine/threonine protein kinase
MLLANMHTHGVLHGDFRPANVLNGPRGFVLIDFSHSDVGHVCPRDSPCWELQNVQSQLNLEDDDLQNKWTWIIFRWRTLRHRLSTRFLPGQSDQITGMSYVLAIGAIIFSLLS